MPRGTRLCKDFVDRLDTPLLEVLGNNQDANAGMATTLSVHMSACGGGARDDSEHWQSADDAMDAVEFADCLRAL
eukprot:15434388-Alexandrium_andersonii.AAC.1